MISSATIIKSSTLLGAVVALGTAGWAVGEYTETRPVILKEFNEYVQVDASTAADNAELLKGLLDQQSAAQSQMATSLMELQFQTLNLKRKSGALDFTEEQSRCRIAKKLDYQHIEGCND
jgi:uncharacterized protein HemX